MLADKFHTALSSDSRYPESLNDISQLLVQTVRMAMATKLLASEIPEEFQVGYPQPVNLDGHQAEAD